MHIGQEVFLRSLQKEYPKLKRMIELLPADERDLQELEIHLSADHAQEQKADSENETDSEWSDEVSCKKLI